jgi:hypothetical protein
MGCGPLWLGEIAGMRRQAMLDSWEFPPLRALSARSVATSPSRVRSESRTVRSDMPTPSPVAADQCVSLRDSFPESPKARALQVKFEVARPPRRSDERWTVPAYLVRHAARANGEEPDLGLLQHCHEPTTAAWAAKGRQQRGGPHRITVL